MCIARGICTTLFQHCCFGLPVTNKQINNTKRKRKNVHFQHPSMPMFKLHFTISPVFYDQSTLNCVQTSLCSRNSLVYGKISMLTNNQFFYERSWLFLCYSMCILSRIFYTYVLTMYERHMCRLCRSPNERWSIMSF